MMKTYFALIGTSRNACGGTRWTVTSYNSASDIIGFAQEECNRSGESLETLVGIGFKTINEGTDDEEVVSEREMTDAEKLGAALSKLNDDGRTYQIYDDSNPEEVAQFIKDAECHFLGDRARHLAGFEVEGR